MRRLLIATALISSLASITVLADDDDRDGSDRLTLAVYGDAPYGCKAGECPDGFNPDTPNGPIPGDPRQLDATPGFIDAVNADPKVRTVVHVGDIHSGSQFCTLAYDQRIFALWTRFKDPLVYTPGDNEWTDCHKGGEGGYATITNASDPNVGSFVDYANGNPVANLALIRSIFFQTPGQTLGARKMRVASQALGFDPAHPSDAEYVENVMWEQAGVLFVTLNIPGGSNNDDDQWYGTKEPRSGAQNQEVAQRTAADLRWLDAAFARATERHDKAVLIAEQADMWDLDGKAPSHIANYEAFLDRIAADTKAFGKPVLLINGDSHAYRSDNPFRQAQPCVIEAGASADQCSDDAWESHAAKNYDVANFHRLVVHGSTFPLEYLRLTVDPHSTNAPAPDAFGPFSWERVIP
jgi:hypothetical protein